MRFPRLFAPDAGAVAGIVMVAGMVMVASGCGPSTTSSGPFENGTVRVATAFYPIEEIVRAVGGAEVSVVDLVPPGESAHDYEPTPQQVTDLQSADVVFYLGSGFQPSVEKAIASLPSGVRKIDLLASVPLIATSPQLAGTDGQTEGEVLGDGNDPHVWLSPKNMQLMVAAVQESLTEVPGIDAAAVATGATNYVATLSSLDTTFSTGLASCASRVIVTSHRAFGYLAAAYDLTQLAISGISPAEEPSAKTLEAVAKAARADKVTTIFFENNLPADLSRTIAREIGADTAVLDPVETLSSDQITLHATYASVMEQNLAALVKGLGCR
ncbi:unannotated protein [freshwater metagenome]|uniref:Unannotated protein n=1 Tax=freshwater metagenome TaxID=449393 RepID=A0A6J7EGW5_9ZZZZ|nr:zinc ABC transporter substrate-binding protein [Actinomycetota bacterium]